MPPIAAVNGHAAAAGLILALSHDHVVVNGAHGFLYMSEFATHDFAPDDKRFDGVANEVKQVEHDVVGR
ncbi:hypothetical protein MLD38_021008 [Melastoma candidum]|uniref:Uncharacterized protein n=1 Tax=Melastoma candidum TaxID=119954 RepID=A0ACB9QEN2_9MYRT|nr:hypothetical protein MLD38_021008 [Melastoma candidum]